eukprot:12892583-Prorocentrum_lima.AAC.1
MLQAEFSEALDQELSNAVIPVNAPPGELVQSASSVGTAGVDDLRSRPSTPTRRTPPSPRERT